MKKVLASIFAIVLALTVTVTAIAAPGGFVSSPSGNKAPSLIDGKNTDEDCPAELEITPYADRDDLDDETQKEFEEAYKSIAENDDLTKISDDLGKIADDKDISPSNLAVSDLFDISYTSCDDHDDHGAFDITLDPEVLDGFVALMRFEDGEWVVVDNAKVDGDHLKFTTEVLGQFAIVVNTGSGSGDAPQTNDTFPWVYIVLMAVSAIGLVVVAVMLKKKKA